MNPWTDLLDEDVVDCLQYLIEKKKARNALFSQRAFAYQLGFSTSTFNEILKGKRVLTRKSIEKLMHGLAGDKDMEGYFDSQGKDLLDIKPLDRRWYYRALLGLVDTEGFVEDLGWISKRLGITVEEAQSGLDDLLSFNYCERSPSGQLTVTSDARSLSAEEQAIDRSKKTQEQIHRLSQVVKETPADERFFGTLVVAIDSEDFEYIRSKMMDLIKEHSTLLAKDGKRKQEVYQLSFGCVPLTKKVSGEK